MRLSGHLAADLRTFVDEITAGLQRLGGEQCDIVDQVPQWFIDGHRVKPTGRPRGRPVGSKDSYQRGYTRKNLPAPTMPDFNLFPAIYGFAGNAVLSQITSQGIQLDPATRTGWTYGPDGTQVQQFSA